MQNPSATPPEALAPLTRRRFLQSASALTFAIGSAGLVTVSLAGANETTQKAAGTEITAWVRIDTDNRVHLVFPSTEIRSSETSSTRRAAPPYTAISTACGSRARRPGGF